MSSSSHINGLSKRKTHRLLSQCQGLELAQNFPPITASQGEEIALRIQRKEFDSGASGGTHPCLSVFLAYRRCVAQFSSTYLSKCTVAANRYRECLDTKGGDWQPSKQANYVNLLQSMGIFHKTRRPAVVSDNGAGSVIRFKKNS